MGMPIARAAVEARPARPRRPGTRGAPARDRGGRETAAVRQLAVDLGLEPGDLLGAAVLHEVTHRVLTRQGAGGRHPLEEARRRIPRQPDAPDLAGTLRAFRPAYPAGSPLPDPAMDAEAGPTRTAAGRTLEELVLLRLTATNPALRGVRPLFDDGPLEVSTDYLRVLAALDQVPAAAARDGGPVGAGSRRGLLAILGAPVAAAPDSLAGQLRWVRRHWGAALTPDTRRRLTLALDLLAEEAHARVLRDRAGLAAAGGPTEGPDLGSADEPERFSPDAPWMPRVVLLAKNAYVWLEQLSREAGREIATLDAIPEPVLADLAARGVNGLWLIGLWERSRASREIKRRMGNPDAAASAYAIDRYVIAADLGGDAALDALRERARRHGIRLASDMVPNHMGLDSTWVLQHPERFIGLEEPPYPNYRFTGPDLSPDPAVAIQLEDGYWDHRDAAVVFRRTERATGEARYLYHGNDGTATPWNDTAQLDYLQASVREAVMELILDVARRFPIIRFDAAMTLARRHIQRLWYPPPGHGGAIPSRAEFGRLSPATFRRRMPHEFWREVVDRVAREAPETLLLAEAFWLMEGYFVRTLGMHRVYNSAFMHMLRDEENAAYRAILRETLAFDPRVLERYVNFMSNPDERTVADQFGTGGKYAGVATLLATLPGLPLLAHGQLEGYRERYGMEFRRPQLDERPDADLAALHEARLFPLLRRRAQFAPAATFRLFDVVAGDGRVLEDVFAYTNR
ncbi:MAG TPA: alpha-amylase family glycosyl hydrolase, partial [Candidatus Sulfotelmatobacter sp.]|nr:alpha-amylase family glycosyl hydrolase [Candidatus Sulfotelmatobacter sp.]